VESGDREGQAVLIHPRLGIELEAVSEVSTDTVDLKGISPGQVVVRVQYLAALDAPEAEDS
jgi:hypothetical protein